MMWLYSWLTARAELQTATPIHEGFTKAAGNPFFVMTGGRATIDTLLSSDPDFSLAPAQAAVTVTKGAAATFHISVMPTRASFDQPVAFSCGTVPSPLACTFSPAQLTPGASGADVTLTVTTGSSATAAGLAGASALIVLAFVRRRKTAWLARAAIAGLVVVNCGGSGSPKPPSTPGTPPAGPAVYTITVTGTSGTLSHATTLTLTVQ
jgi:hypothetical protein